MIYFKILNGFFPPTSSLAAMFSFISCSQFTLFAMWFDMEANKELKLVITIAEIITHIASMTLLFTSLS